MSPVFLRHSRWIPLGFGDKLFRLGVNVSSFVIACSCSDVNRKMEPGSTNSPSVSNRKGLEVV